MGTVTTTVTPVSSGSPKTLQSKGGLRFERLIGKHLMGATYATGGDTVTMPAAPPGGTLFCINILATPALPVGFQLVWDGSIVTPKIIAYDEGAAVFAELANANAALAAQVLFLEFIYKIGPQ